MIMVDEPYVRSMHSRIALWEAELELLMARARERKVKAVNNLEQEVKELREKGSVARQRLRHLSEEALEGAEQLRDELDRTWTQIKRKTDSLRSRLMTEQPS